MIQSLLGNSQLYSIASWADDVRRERKFYVAKAVKDAIAPMKAAAAKK
jgi:hypothetical protein